MKSFTNTLFLLLVCSTMAAQLPDNSIDSIGVALLDMKATLHKIEQGICPEDEKAQFQLAVGFLESASTQDIPILDFDIDRHPFDGKWDGRLEISPDQVVIIQRGKPDMILKVKGYHADNVHGIIELEKGATLIKGHSDFLFLNVEQLDSRTHFRDIHRPNQNND